MDLSLVRIGKFGNTLGHMNAFYLTSKTGPSGEFLFENVPVGDYLINMGKGPYMNRLPAQYAQPTSEERVRITVGDQDIEDLVVKLKVGAIVRGTVLLPSGEGA